MVICIYSNLFGHKPAPEVVHHVHDAGKTQNHWVAAVLIQYV